MPSSAQRKGKGYEREIAKKLSKAFDCNVRRVPNSGGLDIKGDLRNLSGPLERFVIECKKQERLNIWACLRQTMWQAGSKVGLLIFSRNNERDYVCLELNDFMAILQNEELKNGQRNNTKNN